MPSCSLNLQVTPRSSQRKVEVESEGFVRVWVTQAPTDGQANQGVIEVLADGLGLPKSKLKIIKGLASRHKTVKIEGLTEEEALTRLRSAQPGTRSPKQRDR